jgi:hypothetical protein
MGLADKHPANPEWLPLMQLARQRLGVRRLALCFKDRDSSGLQRRWSGASGMLFWGRLIVRLIYDLFMSQ